MKGSRKQPGSSSRRREFFKDVRDAEDFRLAVQSDDGHFSEEFGKNVLARIGANGASCMENGRKDLQRATPNCLCGLIPTQTQNRKKGVWGKMADRLEALGEDPSSNTREAPNVPAGISNLGNTCYMGSALQLLFSIRAIKHALLLAENEGGSSEEKTIAEAVRGLFAEMEFSPLGSTSPKDLCDALRLDVNTQQDPQEFLKLFQNLLEKAYEKDKNYENIFEEQFGGGTSYVTVCKECTSISASSFTVHNFLDLQLQVEGCKTLHKSLEEYTAPCHLTGNNKYNCEYCQKPSEAERRVLIRSLPPILQITLTRFNFDFESGGKRKVRSAIGIPLDFDFSGCLKKTSRVLKEKPKMEDSKYTLTCILHHLGTSANSGHYVAQVRCPATGDWWLLDDNAVTKIGEFPTGDPGQAGGKKPKDLNTEEMFSSASAYILIYTEEALWTKQCESQNLSELPSLVQIAEDARKRAEEKLEKFKAQKEEISQKILDRQNFLRSVLSKSPVKSTCQDRWISAKWLISCMDTEEEPPEINNTELLCAHGKLDPFKTNLGKRISVGSFEMLQKKYKGGPQIETEDVCITCLMDACNSYIEKNREADVKSSIITELREIEKGFTRDDDFWISKTWLTNWKRRNGNKMEVSPTLDITCDHRELKPEAAAKRSRVPKRVWEYFKECHEQNRWRSECASVNGGEGPSKKNPNGNDENPPIIICSSDDNGDLNDSKMSPFNNDEMMMVEFPVNGTQDCMDCLQYINEEDVRQKQILDEILNLKSSVPRLASGAALQLEPNLKYYLIPKEWIQSWRGWISNKGRKGWEIPVSLGEWTAHWFCKCHKDEPGAAVKPPCVANMRGKFYVEEDDETFDIVTEDEWNFLSDYYKEGNKKIVGLACFLEFQEQVSSDNQAKKKQRSGNGSVAVQSAELVTLPKPCTDHFEELAARPLTPYTDISFEIAVAPDEAAAKLPGSGGAAATSRSRRRSNKSTIPVSSTDTLHALKMKIFQGIFVSVPNQRLFWDGMEVQGESTTVGELGLKIGTVINVVNAHVIDDSDMGWLDEEIAKNAAGENDGREKKETGFANTLLLGGSAV